MSRQFPYTFRCEECGVILRGLHEAWQADRKEVLSSNRDPMELRNEWLSADDFQMLELFQTQYSRSIAARRKKTEHEILTGHNVMMHGMWNEGLGRRF